ncbi:phosphatase PAP2 family protein [Paeniglutamicibacter cryotolerans]|uniref:Undecaprenyl-diphosphatase n=1 Tax=Paeniglutamicibacter cryotolerans TaxID=670079 RepID=A0A839QI96_9MICC|nr:phosphatase PAP2 family protein [Paeniglutamicibacter cryotolerans]MBB2994245.1 undecaprenyl-diphosphatase [Paeniglutamicibacter cryotolerans]
MTTLMTRPRPGLHRGFAAWWLAPIGIVLFAAALLLGIVAKGAGPLAPELGVDIALSHERNPLLNALALCINAALSPVGGALILAVLCCAVAFLLRRPLQALAFGSTASIGWLSAEIGKFGVSRIRPPGDATRALILESGADSFPSGHTAFAVAIVWAIVAVSATAGRRRWILLGLGSVFVAVVGCSRLYLGVHYPSDVIGAILVSSAGVLLWMPIWGRLLEPRLAELGLIRKLSGPTGKEPAGV